MEDKKTVTLSLSRNRYIVSTHMARNRHQSSIATLVIATTLGSITCEDSMSTRTSYTSFGSYDYFCHLLHFLLQSAYNTSSPIGPGGAWHYLHKGSSLHIDLLAAIDTFIQTSINHSLQVCYQNP